MQGFGERVAFPAEFDLFRVRGLEVVLSQDLVYSVPPESERGLRTFDSVGIAKEVIEDSCDLIHSGCRDTSPQKGLGCREAREHAAKTGGGNVRLVLVVQRRGVGEPKEYLKTEFFLPEGGVIVAQCVPEVGMGERE